MMTAWYLKNISTGIKTMQQGNISLRVLLNNTNLTSEVQPDQGSCVSDYPGTGVIHVNFTYLKDTLWSIRPLTKVKLDTCFDVTIEKELYLHK